MIGRLRAAFDHSFKDISPFDVRCMLGLICIPLAYKLLSLDFTGLGQLCERPTIFHINPMWLKNILSENRCLLFSGDRTRYLQLTGAACLVATTLRPTRWLLVPAICCVWLLDTGAALYRFNFFTIDTPLALLTLFSLTPVRIAHVSSWSTTPNTAARALFLSCFTYVAGYYILAGMAKLQFDPQWAWAVKIGNYYPISYMWHGQTFPEPYDSIARLSSNAFHEKPWLDTLSAFLVLVEQFAWILAPFSVLARFHAGLFSAGYHIVVALTTGIVFVTWVPIALAVSLPFSRIWLVMRRHTTVHPSCLENAPRFAASFAVCVSLTAAIVPSRGSVYPPFYNYLAFGWRYIAPEELKPIYRIGFRHPETHQLQSLPLHHAGFLDFMQVGYLDVSARQVIEHQHNKAVLSYYSEAIRSLLTVLRAPDANGWLLGEWRAPVHLLSDQGNIAVHKLRRFVIMLGTPLPRVGDRPVMAKWQTCGEINLDMLTTETMVTIRESCIDEN